MPVEAVIMRADTCDRSYYICIFFFAGVWVNYNYYPSPKIYILLEMQGQRSLTIQVLIKHT